MKRSKIYLSVFVRIFFSSFLFRPFTYSHFNLNVKDILPLPINSPRASVFVSNIIFASFDLCFSVLFFVFARNLLITSMDYICPLSSSLSLSRFSQIGKQM